MRLIRSSIVLLFIGIAPYLFVLPFSGPPDYASMHATASEFGFFPWLRWDSFLYLSIARDGYYAYECGKFICGNTGWFPLYPALNRILVGISTSSYVWSSLFISLASFVISAELLSRLVSRRWSTIGVACALVLLPGGIYQVSAFPVSLSIALGVSTIYLSQKHRYWLAAITAFLAGLAYPSNIVLVAALIPVLVVPGMGTSLLVVRVKRVFSIFAPLVGFIFGRSFISWASGFDDAFVRTQAAYGHSIGFGFEVLRSSLKYFWKNPTFAQTAFVFMLMIGSTMIICQILRRSANILGFIFLSLGWSYWLIPHIIGDSLSIYRQEALLSPFIVYAASHLSRKCVLILALPCVVLSIVMGFRFFDGTLV